MPHNDHSKSLVDENNVNCSRMSVDHQIKLKTRMYRDLQKQADDCYDDLGDLLTYTISKHSNRNLNNSSQFCNSHSLID